MSFAKTMVVKESPQKIKSLLKKAKPLFIPRLRMLLEIKNSEEALSKISLSSLVGVNHNSIQKWRKMYEKGGLTGLLAHKTNASRPSVFSQSDHKAIRQKLEDPNNGLRGYKELLEWVREELSKDVKYDTLMKYCRVNFGSKIKVARKSHVKKDEEAVQEFKKTLVAFAQK